MRWHTNFSLAEIANDTDSLLVDRTLCEHAQLQHPSGAALEFDDDVRVVKDVRNTSVIAFVHVVHAGCGRRKNGKRFTTNDLKHQIEEVAALLHESPTGVLVESIPRKNLVQERKPMFNDRDESHITDNPAIHLVEQPQGRSHEPILEPDTDDLVGRFACRALKTKAGIDCGGQRFFNEDMLLGLYCSESDFKVGVVRTRHNDDVDGRLSLGLIPRAKTRHIRTGGKLRETQ